MPTAVRRLIGQASGRPSDVFDQSTDRAAARAAPSPEKMAKDEAPTGGTVVQVAARVTRGGCLGELGIVRMGAWIGAIMGG